MRAFRQATVCLLSEQFTEMCVELDVVLLKVLVQFIGAEHFHDSQKLNRGYSLAVLRSVETDLIVVVVPVEKRFLAKDDAGEHAA